MLLSIFILSIFGVGCQKVLDINTDPNNPSSATPELLLPTAQVALGVAFGDEYHFVTSMWAQYWTSGTTISTTPLENFTMTGGEVNRSWRNTYSRSLLDLSQIIKSGNPYYSGISKVLMAFTYQRLVDIHGDIPFSEALKGAIEDGGILTPKFDSDKDVYDALIPILDDAITDLSSNDNSYAKPSSEDLVYGGDLDNWIIFANTLKLKILLRQSLVDNTKLAEALTLLQSGVSFIDQNNSASIYFNGSTLGNSNPTWLSYESRSATKMYMRASKTSINVLDSLSDPRIATIYDAGTSGYIGIPQGEANIPAPVGVLGQANNSFAQPSSDYIYSNDLPVWLISPWESKFIQAEILLRSAVSGDDVLFEEAVTASFDYFGLSSSASAYISSLDYTTNKIKTLAIQKWISMNGLQPTEGWIETRRFDIESTNNIIFRGVGGIFYDPSSTSLPSNVFPSKMLYGSSESSYNPNTPTTTVTAKVFWDN
ncbi:MAG: SusD/RagB family nutrient-binding outer membrane lipoprotein [Chitinophagales bacterium]